MQLDAAQKSTILAYINSQPALAALPNDPDSASTVASALNALAGPAFWVWRSSVDVADIMAANFRWADVDALTVGKARIWDLMTRLGTINPSLNNVRTGITDCWGAASTNETRIFNACRRRASVVEKILATGAGTTADPATMAVEGVITYQEVQTIRSP